MTILKRNNFVATLIYVLFYFSPILANPFAYLNIMEAAVLALLIYGCAYLHYIYFYTAKSKLSIQTKNTIITIIVLLIAAMIYFDFIKFPVIFNIIINRYLAIILLGLVLLLGLLIFFARKIKSSFVFLLLFTPQIIQGILMRTSYSATIFYVNNPNLNMYIILAILFGYYVYNGKKNK